jgi:type I restriction-modification system DNA methylase subunit
MPATSPHDLFAAFNNSGLFSSHWLENRLNMEPEWEEQSDAAKHALESLGKLWKVQRKRVEKYGDEQGLEEAFIQPVLKELGWKLKYQTFLQGRKPDYALFLTEDSLERALDQDRTAPEFWEPVTVVADAKAWHVNLDRPSETKGQREFPPEQIEWYLDKSRKDWGILTNGKQWRLFPRDRAPQQKRFETYLEIDLSEILDRFLAPVENLRQQHAVIDDFLRFYLLFSPVSLCEPHGRATLLKRAAAGSSEYRVGVSEGLKGQTFEALRFCIEGFLAFKGNGLKAEIDLGLCREQSFVLLGRLLFIMFAEDRRLLPYRVHKEYTDNRSLGKQRDDVAARLTKIPSRLAPEYDRSSTALWEELQSLFNLIDEGKPSYKVPAYNGGLFDPDAHRFLAVKKLSDWHLARVIDHLGRAPDPQNPRGEHFRVDYRDLAIQHLGGIYEGLLELHPHLAEKRMVVYTRRERGVREEIVAPAGAGRPEGYQPTEVEYAPGSVYLVTDKGERRAFGSYYTPDSIVEYIVRETLGPLCARIDQQLRDEIQAAEKTRQPAEVERLRADYSTRVLGLRVLDPSMGSGHFLLAACDFLAEEIATNPFTPESPQGVGEGESAIRYWKRRVIENCLYGVDLNPMAVDIARLALWLHTVASDRPLTFLDHHLRHGNSLIGAKLDRLGQLGKKDAYTEAFGKQFESKLPALLKPLAEIRALPSETVKQVKDKGRRFETYAAAVEPFRKVADLWTASAIGIKVPADGYHDAIDALGRKRAFQGVASQEWFQTFEQEVRSATSCFAWELAFPEVFFADDGRLKRPGFDAIIGNPPYEVLSEKESGQDLKALRAFIDAEPTYKPAQMGKQNLYKLFICRCLDLLADDGRFGFIVPMSLLGDEITSGVRKEMAARGAFVAIEAFPQKDRPSDRVFFEAKLSTCIFVFEKTKSAADQRFRARNHPGKVVEESSSSLALSTAEIPKYDPENFTIVSCSQSDWDLAVKIMASGRLDRLGKWAESFQGEVNESNDRKSNRIGYEPTIGPEVIRGAHLSLYAIREASQGTAVFLNKEQFLDRSSKDKDELKAFHHRHRRIGFQRKSPQNNFRRLVAALIPRDTFLLESISYIPEHKSRLDLHVILAVLNSKLADWYFRLGSTNAMVSEYQVSILPCPVFAEAPSEKDQATQSEAIAQLRVGRTTNALQVLRRLLNTPPFSTAVREAIIEAARRIIAIEQERGEIARRDRSALDPAAQPYQDFIDQLLYGMAGLTDDDVKALEASYERML